MKRAAQAGQGGAVRIACINRATVGLGLPLDKLTAALQRCYDECFKPIWGYPVQLYNTTKPAPSDWQFLYLDDADAAGALGYHDLTVNGQPVSKVFVKTILQAKESVSVTACHELFEMVQDPVANTWAENTDGKLYAYEMSDPVEEDTFEVDGVTMSNFVTPAWFEPFKHAKGTRFDYLRKLKAPFSMTAGGYMIVRDKTGKVDQVFGSAAKRKRFAREDRRGHRSEHRRAEGELIAPCRRPM